MPAHSPLRCFHSMMTQRGTHEVVLMDTGNYPGFSNYLNETWTWNGTDWSRIGGGIIDTVGPLPLRADFAMEYDGYNVVLFGGRGESETSGVQDDTWTWNGTAWNKESPATVPFGRFKAKLAFLNVAGSQQAIMFGGSNVLNFLSETWLWNGSTKTWTLAAPAASPPVRVDHAMAANTTKVVVFGGKNTNSCTNDTWLFDGTNWSKAITPVVPSVRAESTLSWNPTLGLFVLFGGRNDDNLLPAETWTFDGTSTWIKVATATAPVGRVGAQMCYDSNTGKTLLFGGNTLTDTLNDTWTFDGTVWVQL